MVATPCHDVAEGKPKSAKFPESSPVSFYMYVEDIEAAFKKAKDAGMTERMPIKDMFWGDRMGSVIDCFNIEWTIAEHVRDVLS